MASWRFDAIGTSWEIETPKPIATALRDRVTCRIDEFDRTYSRFRTDSLVALIASSAVGGSVEFPEDSLPLFTLYDKLHDVTGGAVDPLVGRDLELMGYDRSYSLQSASPEALRTEWAGRRLRWSHDVVRNGCRVAWARPCVIDVGAAGKGYLIDIIGAMLRDGDVSTFTVDASGDILKSGDMPLRIGLEHPFATDRVVGVLNLGSGALCASAVNRRAWGAGLHHIVDGRTGKPADDVVATWATAHTAAVADGIATALFFTHADDLHRSFDFTYARMHADGRIETSSRFDGEIFE